MLLTPQIPDETILDGVVSPQSTVHAPTASKIIISILLIDPLCIQKLTGQPRCHCRLLFEGGSGIIRWGERASPKRSPA